MRIIYLLCWMAEMTTLHKIQGTSPVCFAQRFKNFVVANVYHFGFNTVCQGNRATFLMRHGKMKVERALLVKRCWWKLKEFWVFLWIFMDFDRFSWIFMDFLLPFLFLQNIMAWFNGTWRTEGAEVPSSNWFHVETKSPNIWVKNHSFDDRLW